MVMTNAQIYKYTQQLTIFNECNIIMPMRLNFYLQKNIRIIREAAEEIDRARLFIGAQFGTPNIKGTGYDILPENITIAQQELADLFELEQDINIHMFKLKDFNGINLTCEQMSAIIFMIEE